MLDRLFGAHGCTLERVERIPIHGGSLRVFARRDAYARPDGSVEALLEEDTLDFVADASPHKQGLYMPGGELEIRSPEALLEEMPDYVLLLAWNFTDEILEQQAEYRQRGGRFIIPIPEPRVV